MSNEIEDTKCEEVLHLHIGSGGIEVGNDCWQLYCLEHTLDMDGCISNEQNPPQCFFSEENDYHRKKFRPRTFFIDCDLTAIDRIKTSRMKNFYTGDQFLVSTDSSDSILNEIRKQVEIYDHFQGFIFSHSTYVKCSNLSSELLINLKSEYTKNIVLTNSIFGSSVDIGQMSNLLKYADVIIPMENKAISDLCHHRLDIKTPTFSNLNRLIALCWSNITCSMRSNGCLLSNLNEFRTSLIPFSSLKLIISRLSPLIPSSYSQNADFKSPSLYDMCLPALIQPHNCFINQINSYKTVLSAKILLRGENIRPKEIGLNLILDMKRSMRWFARSSTGFRCAINYHRPYIFDDQSDIALTDKQVLMLTNETSTSKYLCEFILNQYEKSSKTELIEAENGLQELKMNYEQFEKEILDDNQDLMTSST